MSASPYNEQVAFARQVLTTFDAEKLIEQLHAFTKWAAESDAANEGASQKLRELNHREFRAHDQMKKARSEYLKKKKELDAIVGASDTNAARRIAGSRPHVEKLEREYNCRHEAWEKLRAEIRDAETLLESNPWALLTSTEPAYSTDAHITELVRYCFPPQESVPGLDTSRLHCLRCVRLSILHDKALPQDYPRLTAGILDKEKLDSVWSEMSGDWLTWRPALEYDMQRLQGDSEAKGLLRANGQEVLERNGQKRADETTGRKPLSKRAGLIYEKLRSLKEHEAMTLPEIQDWYANKTEKDLDEGTWKRLRKELQAYGLDNRPNVGYYIREKQPPGPSQGEATKE